MTSDSLEKQVGKQSYGRGVNNLKPFHPLWRLTATAVRRKDMAVSDV